MIRKVLPADATGIAAIYNHYVLNTIVTFDEQVVSIEAMENKITTVTAEYPWLVDEEQGRLRGYAYAGVWKPRDSYRYAVESSVYLHPDQCGKGIGSNLYDALISELKNRDIRTVIGGISLPNEGSIALHEKFGFKKAAHFTEVGYKLNKWIDVGYWQLLIDRS